MTTYGFDVTSQGDWSNADDWVNATPGIGAPGHGTPGAGDTAYITSDNQPTIVTTDLQSVAIVIGNGNGGDTLVGAGLNVSDSMNGIELLGGAYYVADTAMESELLSGTLSGNFMDSVTVKGGKITSSNKYIGEVYDGVVNTVKLLSATLLGGIVNAGAIFLGSSRFVNMSGGKLNDQKGLTLEAQSLDTNAFVQMTGGAGTVGGMTTVGDFGILRVSGAGKLTLQHGLHVGEITGSQSQFSVGSVITPGGNVTVSAGPVIFGGSGTATVGIMKGGRFDASASNVKVGELASSSTSALSVNNGLMITQSLTIGESGNANLVISKAGQARGATLAVGANVGSVGAVSVKNYSSVLNFHAVTVGGTTSAQGGSGAITIGSETDAIFTSATIWQTGVIKDNGDLKFIGDVAGPGTLKIGQGAVAAIGGAGAQSLNVNFTGAGDLVLYQPSSFQASVDHIVAGASIDAKGFEGGSISFVQGSPNVGTVFLTGASFPAAYAALHFDGNFNASDFAWNAASAKLTFM